MPSLTKEFLEQLKGGFQSFPCFIETGTANGDTTFALEPYFNKVYTIEYSMMYFNRTRSQYRGNKINFLLGDSSIVFEYLLPTIQEKAIFFLDGHWSSGDTGRSKKDCPLYEEITHINNLFKNEAIIIVDDCRLFGTHVNEDWSQINKESLLGIIESRIKDVYFLDSESAKEDRLIIHINPK